MKQSFSALTKQLQQIKKSNGEILSTGKKVRLTKKNYYIKLIRNQDQFSRISFSSSSEICTKFELKDNFK